MGNIGRPSTGCGLCRKRRVKCDEGRPGCCNCARLKKPCPGYRAPGYGLIRKTVFVPRPENENPNASSTESLALAGQISSHSSISGAGVRNHIRTGSQSPQTPGILHVVPSDVTEHAVWYSLGQFDTTSRVLYGNTAFQFLPEIMHKAGTDSHLYAAMRAVGVINLANRSPTVDMRSVVDFEYANAVSAVTAALAHPDKWLTDETLVAVWLLGVRELLAGVAGATHTSTSGLSRQTHVDGTLMLLRLRGETQFRDPEGRHLYHTLLSSMHWKPLFAGEEPTQEYLNLEAQIPKATSAVPNASLRLRSFFHDVSKLRARVKNFLDIADNEPLNRSDLVDSYLKAGARLEDKLDGWCDIPEWQPREVVVDSPTQYTYHTAWTFDDLFRLHCFKCWDGFFHWNRYYVARICLHAALLDALAQIEKQSPSDATVEQTSTRDDLVSLHTAVLQDNVRDFLGVLAYAFGDVDECGRLRSVPTPVLSDGASTIHRGINTPATLQTLAPLSYLITLRYLEPSQREAMYLALRRIRAEFRVR
ncbi:hypothetical protein EDD37DRAFT_108889 [Exophiala viscosa]|uniref:uncharacterized protein n=1 Tax=Exophiala viscosa TaxID=2486360 RepID=UPI00219D30A0|nr:hypothetical protein EDD37DRAFT_108889 [Exophiala viscosa]